MDEFASVRLTRHFAAPAADVWAVLTEPESVTRWLGHAGGRFATGQEVELSRDGDVESVVARVRELNPERVLELDWHPRGEPPSVVRIELSEEPDGTKLVLDHRRLDERACLRHASRWRRRLEELGLLVDVTGVKS